MKRYLAAALCIAAGAAGCGSACNGYGAYGGGPSIHIHRHYHYHYGRR